MKKICTKCGTEGDASLEDFPPNSKSKDGLGSWCRVCTRKLDRDSYSKNRGEKLARKKEYRSTLNGHLRLVYKNMNRRCSDQSDSYKDQSYRNRGIKNLFQSMSEFRNYVVGVLKIDPRGLQIHRIDNDGNYEPGNIEFLTSEEHKIRHKTRRR